MIDSISNKTILLITGLPCVGKTTVAYEILKSHSEFRRVTELDIIRTIVRTVLTRLNMLKSYDSKRIESEYKELFSSLRLSDYNTARLQSDQLVPFVKEIILRQQRRNIPTIIEGTEIIPSSYFPNCKRLDWIDNNIIFIYLYVSDINEHINRHYTRCLERSYDASFDLSKDMINKIRNKKYELFLSEVLKLKKYNNNIFCFDVTNMDKHEVAKFIIEQLNSYFKNGYSL